MFCDPSEFLDRNKDSFADNDLHTVSSHKRQPTHAGRLRQLQHLEQQIADATDWKQKLTKIVTTQNRSDLLTEAEAKPIDEKPISSEPGLTLQFLSRISPNDSSCQNTSSNGLKQPMAEWMPPSTRSNKAEEQTKSCLTDETNITLSPNDKQRPSSGSPASQSTDSTHPGNTEIVRLNNSVDNDGLLNDVSVYYDNGATNTTGSMPTVSKELSWKKRSGHEINSIHSQSTFENRYFKENVLSNQQKPCLSEQKAASDTMPSTTFATIRNKFEMEAQINTTQPFINRFDPLLSREDERQTTEERALKDSKRTIQDTLQVEHRAENSTCVFDPSNDQLICADTTPKKQQSAVPNAGLIDKLIPAKSVLASSPTRLPTPKTKSNQFALPFDPQQRGEEFMRTFSPTTNDSLKWVENVVVFNQSQTKSTFAVSTPKIDQPRSTTSAIPGIKSGNSAKRSLASYISEPEQTTEQKADIRATNIQEEVPSSPRARLIWLSMQRAQSIHVTQEGSPDETPLRTRKASMLSTMSCGKANRALADFDPLLTDDSDDIGIPNKINIKRSSMIRPKSVKGTVDPLKTSECPHSRGLETVQPFKKEGAKVTTTSSAIPSTACFASPECDTKNSVKPPSQRSPTRIPLPISKPLVLSKQENGSSGDGFNTNGDNHNGRKNNANTKRSMATKIGPTTVTSGSAATFTLPKPTRADTKTVRKPTSFSALKVPNNWSKNTVAPEKQGATHTRKASTANVCVNKFISGDVERRPSITNANDLLHDQLEKEKAKSRRLSVNLISAQGVISLPESIKSTSNETRGISSTAKIVPSGGRKMSSFRERLQELVTEDVWSIHAEHGKAKSQKDRQEEDALGNISTSTTASAREEIATLYSKHETEQSRAKSEQQSKLIREKEKGLRVAMSSQTALKLHKNILSPYEREEILEHSQIYFVGPHAKKRHASLEHTTSNFGYDDEGGDYHIVLRDHLVYRYEALEVMGKGSFGQVIKCFDHKTGQTVAIKIIRNKKRFHAQAMVEVKVLENLMRWDPEDKHNNVRMTDHFYFRSHLCIAFECLSINLYDFIKSNNFQGFSMGLIRRFTIQLLNSLVLLYKHKLIHCDLKPENILLKHPTKSTIKVIDFGSSCLESEKVYTYIQSRFYRSPEVILGSSYSMAIDMWSVGCILAELFTGHPIFAGENEQDQLACIMEIRGVPEKHLIDGSSRRKLFFDSYGNPRIMPNSKGRKRKPGTKKLAQALKCTDDNFTDFIDRCLQWDPARRLNPIAAFKHPWIRCKKST
ncbi:hypothetical protein EC973_009288 [Apophysomyces ossiformis]|uniref:dual-specificity kinase n=1 Tax=Apophysomyces ossiformis TaxID=679940 RepID=A0A8H7C0E9_9FUNG|nr:hypothetical protein EC973_009288 [Apophysomyces ossiformis]